MLLLIPFCLNSNVAGDVSSGVIMYISLICYRCPLLGTCLEGAPWSLRFFSASVQASDRHTATVVCSSQASTSSLSFDQLCYSTTQLSCSSRAEVEAAVGHHLAQFQEQSGYGMLLLLFALLLTHGIR